MHKKKVFKNALALTLAFSMLAGSVGIDTKAAENAAEVSIGTEKVSIGNDYIAREFSIENGKIKTETVLNKRIGTELEPQSGSEDFVISTITSQIENEEDSEDIVTIEAEPISTEGWTATLTNGTGTAFSATEVNKLFDGNKSTNVDNYLISGFPFTLDIDFGVEQTIASMSVDKRPGYFDKAYGVNGTMGGYEIWVSENDSDYTKITEGAFTEADYNLHEENGLYNVGDTVYATFDEVTTRYVRIVQTGAAVHPNVEEFTSAEIDFYAEKVEWAPGTEEDTQEAITIASSALTFKNAESEDLEDGEKLTISYEPYESDGVTYDISQVLVLKDTDAYMRSFLEISVSDMDKAQIDYIDTDSFVLPEDVEGLWSHPEESKVSSMWIGKHELMLGQPIYVNGFFMGSEFPAADTLVTDNTTQIRYYSGKTFTQLKADNQLTTDDKFVSWQNVIGAAQGTETAVVQTDFFAYIEEIATPTEFRKQYNSWYDNMMNITDASIAASFNDAEAGLTQNGVEPLDSYVVDDGWNNYYSVIDGTTYVGASSSAGTGTPNQTGFWEFNTKFPNELYTSSALADKFQSTFGLWLGPQGGYNYFGGFSQYLEAMGTGYSQNDYWRNVCVGSDRYVKNLQNLFIDYQERFNIDYWKWDGFALRPCTNADHDHMTGGYKNMYYTTDLWEKWTDLFEAARAARAEEGKGLFINATCYVNLSPWLLQWVNTIWVQDSGDTGQLGTGERHEQKIYYRDQVYYQLYRQNEVQFPLKNIYNHDPIYGVSDSSNATTEVFREFLFANAVRGTAFWELYYSPSIMDDAKWKVTTDALAWAEENHEILKNAKLFGNQPKTGVYGYSSWNGNEGIISFTNPLDTEQTYELTVDKIVGAPETVKDLTGIQVEPYRTGVLETTLSYGDTLTVTLQPHETIIYHFGHEDEAAPELVSAKVTGDNTVTLKFDERVQLGDFTVNGEAVTAELKEDYRTVVLTTENTLKKNCTVTASVEDFNGNSYDETLKLTYYKNDVIAAVRTSENLKSAAEVQDVYDETTGITWLQNITKEYVVDTNNRLSGTEDFTISLGVRTESTNVDLFKSGRDVSLSINEEGFVEFKVNGLVLSSKEEVTTVVEKAHGTFGTEEYVPTTSMTQVVGNINDGEAHSVEAVREANGMLKLYIDGELTSSLYEEDHINEAVTGGKMTVADDGFSGDMTLVQILNSALAYDEVHTADMLGKERVESDREGWTAEACSEMPGTTGDATAMAAIDGSGSSWWHTNYMGGDTCSDAHWIQVNFNKEETFDQFIYTGRGAASNGSIKDYKLELLDENGNVIETIEGQFSAEEATTAVDLGKLYTAYGVRLTAVSTHNGNNFAAAVEMNISRPEETVYEEEQQEVVRLSGTTRYETGYKVADALKEELGVDKFDAVVVATGKNFADALAGSYLAVQKNAPIILTNGKDDNVAQLHEYIAANVAAGGKVYILGGDAAVPASVEAIEGYDVVRLSGKSRYETNLAILAEAGFSGDELIVATGKTFADSLSASAAKLPILLVKPGTALTDEAKAIAEGMNKIYIIGGEGAVSADIATELAAYGEVVRVSGKTRYETSVAVANTFFADVEEAVTASAKNFPDGLCGGPLAAAMNAPLILTADGKTDAAAAYMAEKAVEAGFVLGGTGALADETVTEIFSLESADEIIVE